MAVGRKGQPVRLRQIPREQSDVSAGVKPIDALEWDLLPCACRESKSGIGKVTRAIRAQHHVTRTVEFFPLITVSQNLVITARTYANHRTENTGAIDQSKVRIDRKSTRLNSS